MTKTRLSVMLGVALIASANFVQGLAVDPKPKPPNPLEPISDTPGLSRVLLIGDSISIGYTLPTRKLLEGRASVHRIPTNGGPTTRGLVHMDAWLGDGKWDIIHFNWGLHDLKFMPHGRRQVLLQAYEKNLDSLVHRLKQTGAKLIWASTTPVPVGKVNPRRIPADVEKYNAAAARVMERHGVSINDLYAFALQRLKKIQRPANVHFSPGGSVVLAGQVAAAIEKWLKAAKR